MARVLFEAGQAQEQAERATRGLKKKWLSLVFRKPATVAEQAERHSICSLTIIAG